MRFFRRLDRPVFAFLLAVAMQATLLLAHAHIHSHAPDRAGSQWSKSASLACRSMVAPKTCRTGMPQQDHRDDCPLCWSLAASGAGVLPTTPAAPQLAIPPHQPRPLTVLPRYVAVETSQFQARAPPVA
jgi:hypothetical protein